jgi:hypothetical protein
VEFADMSTLHDERAAAKKNRKSARAPGKRRGSETRKPSKLVHVRYPLEEYERLERQAAAAGLKLSPYVRQKTNGIRPTRSGRRKSPEQRLAAQYLAQVGKIGSNLNQIARAANMNQAGTGEFAEALKEIRAFKVLLQRILRTGR